MRKIDWIYVGVSLIGAIISIGVVGLSDAHAAVNSYDRSPSGSPLEVVEFEVLTLDIGFDIDTSGACDDLATHYQWMYQIDGGGWIDVGGGSFNGTLPVSATGRSWGVTSAGDYDLEIRLYTSEPGDLGGYCWNSLYDEFTVEYAEQAPDPLDTCMSVFGTTTCSYTIENNPVDTVFQGFIIFMLTAWGVIWFFRRRN